MRSESVLEHLLSEGIISEVLGRLQSGKEAEVFVVRCQGNVVAAKVYKDRTQRNFKNNSSYKEGRSVRNSRSQRAMERGSKYGKDAAEDAWKSAEVNALYTLHAANVRVPTPVMFFEGVLIMELVRDAAGNTAPRLIDVSLTPEQANAGYHDMLAQLVRMLSCELIHGDLSPYNVLWAAAGPTVIDFPQIISAAQNSNSERFFLRDANNILGHFASIDRTLHVRSGDAHEIWRAYAHRDLTPDFLPTGKPRPAPRPPAQVNYPRAQVNVPRAQQTNVPRAQQTNVPRAQANVPRAQLANGPRTQQANAPRTQQVNAPRTQQVNVPRAQQTNVPRAQANVPRTQQTNVPRAQANVPRTQQANVPRAQQTNAPRTQANVPRAQANIPRDQGSSERGHAPFQRQQPPARTSGNPRRPIRTPEVLLARRPPGQASTRPPLRPPGAPLHARPGSAQSPRAEPVRGSSEDSDRSRHRRPPRRRS